MFGVFLIEKKSSKTWVQFPLLAQPITLSQFSNPHLQLIVNPPSLSALCCSGLCLHPYEQFFAVEISVRRKDCLQCRTNGSCRRVVCSHPIHPTFLHSAEEQLSNALGASLCSVQTINSFFVEQWIFSCWFSLLNSQRQKLPWEHVVQNCPAMVVIAELQRGNEVMDFISRLAGGSVILGCHLALHGCFLRCKMEPLPTCSPHAEFCTLAG